jgi:DNA-binding GntR family transcriptional regulator
MSRTAAEVTATAARRLPEPSLALTPRTSAERAARYVRRLIFDGHLHPRDRVPQDDVAAALGISRIPLREALIALEREGWVTIEPHRGAFVNALDEAAVRDHYELYGLTFGLAARRAIERDPDGLVAELETLARAAAREDDVAEFGRLAVAFHEAIVVAGASPRIRVVLRAISTLIPGNFFAIVPNSIAIEREGLLELLTTIRRRDPEATCYEYSKLMRLQADQVVLLLEERKLFDVPG